MDKEEVIIDVIEEARKRMYKAAKQYGFSSLETLKISQNFYQILNLYHSKRGESQTIPEIRRRKKGSHEEFIIENMKKTIMEIQYTFNQLDSDIKNLKNSQKKLLDEQKCLLDKIDTYKL